MKRRSLILQLQRAWAPLNRSSRFCCSVIPSPSSTTPISFFSKLRTSFVRKAGSSGSLDLRLGQVSTSGDSAWKNGRLKDFRQRGLSGTAGSPELAAGLKKEVEKEKVDCVVIGAGVVGLAVARELAKEGREVLVLEAAGRIGTGTSSRNSEVLHAGIYYPRGSLKARLCVEGKDSMYAYCREREVPHKRVTKLIVATGTDQISVLERLFASGKSNNVNDLYMITGEEAMKLEPALQCVKALVSPSTGIVDSHAFTSALQRDAEELGVSFAFNTAVIKGSITSCGIQVSVGDTSCLARMTQSLTWEVTETMILSARAVINAAGLFAQSIARRIKGLPSETIPRGYYAKGCYFSLSGVSKPPFTRLIYPVPEEGGIGVHVTMDLGGQTRFGPDVEWLPHLNDEALFPAQFDYVVDPKRGDKFYAEVRRYFPDLPDGGLQPGYSGIRPKLSGRGQPPTDFLIQGKDLHGVPGLVNLYGIESPGLTSSLAIAKLVASLVSR